MSTPPRILVMDDEELLLDIFSRALRRAGYEVTAVATIQQARAALDGSHFDLFLCDIHMGRERSTGLLGEQTAALQARGTQVVVMSAEPQYRELCEALGITSYLEKPIIPNALVSIAKTLLSQGETSS